MLFALSSAFRASSIQHLSIKFMAKATSCYKFSFKKGWRKGKAPLPVTFQEYTQDETLSVDYGGIYCPNREVEIWRRALSIFVNFSSPLQTIDFFHNIWMAKNCPHEIKY